MSAVRFMAFADRSCSFVQDVQEISRFSCMLFLSVRGFLDYAGPSNPPAIFVVAVLPSSHRNGVGVLFHPAFRSSIARPTDTSVYASSGISRRRLQDSRPGWIRCSFPVGLFHPLQNAGLSRRSPVGRPSGSNRKNSSQVYVQIRRIGGQLYCHSAAIVLLVVV
jgi:hypothetical protein